MKIVISAAEASSDVHCAHLVVALKKICFQRKINLEVLGLGGPRLKAQGQIQVLQAKDFLVMGISEVLGRLPKILRAARYFAHHIQTQRPDLIILADYPGFHFKLTELLIKKDVKSPIVYFIPPKVWVWKKHRTRFLAKMYKKVFCIFPFEENFLREHDVPAVYLGNPILDELPLNLTKASAREGLGLGQQDQIIALMPGSRPSEISKHLPLLIGAVGRYVEFKNQDLQIIVPLSENEDVLRVKNTIESLIQELPSAVQKKLNLKVFSGKSAQCLKAADFGLIKSGTSTLEAGLMGLNHLVMYKPSVVTEFVLRKIFQYKKPVGLINLVLGYDFQKGPVVPECIGSQATSQNIFEVWLRQEQKSAQDQVYKRFDEIRQSLGRQESPSLAIANALLDLIGQGNHESS